MKHRYIFAPDHKQLVIFQDKGRSISKKKDLKLYFVNSVCSGASTRASRIDFELDEVVQDLNNRSPDQCMFNFSTIYV